MAEILVVVSRIKKMAKGAGLRTGGDYLQSLSERVNQMVNSSIEKVKADGKRKTIGTEDL